MPRTKVSSPIQEVARQFLGGAEPDLATMSFGEQEITVVTRSGEISLARGILEAKQALGLDGNSPTALDTEAGVGLLIGAAMERQDLVRGSFNTAVNRLVKGMAE